MSNYAHTHHADSGSDLDDIDNESATLVEGAGRSLNLGTSAARSYSQHPSGSAIANAYAAVSARLERLPLCCCKLTPFKVFIFLLFAVGFALLIPGILMRLESVVSPSPLLLFNLCRQPSSWSAGTLEKFRRDVSRKDSREGRELRL